MTEQHKELILAQVAQVIEATPYGKITLECRGPERPVDIIVENRIRVPNPQLVPLSDKKNRVERKG